MNADGIVSILVGIFGVHTLGQWGEGISQTGVFLHFLTLFRRQLRVAGNVFKCFVDVNIACSLVKQRTSCIQFCLHTAQHIIDSREIDNLLSELGTLLCIGQAFVVSFLLYANALGGNAQSCAVHQGHHILDEA